MLVFRIEVNERSTQRENQKDVCVSLVRQRQPQSVCQGAPPAQQGRCCQKSETHSATNLGRMFHDLMISV
jgi:hypothetical protein